MLTSIFRPTRTRGIHSPLNPEGFLLVTFLLIRTIALKVRRSGIHLIDFFMS